MHIIFTLYVSSCTINPTYCIDMCNVNIHPFNIYLFALFILFTTYWNTSPRPIHIFMYIKVLYIPYLYLSIFVVFNSLTLKGDALKHIPIGIDINSVSVNYCDQNL